MNPVCGFSLKIAQILWRRMIKTVTRSAFGVNWIIIRSRRQLRMIQFPGARGMPYGKIWYRLFNSWPNGSWNSGHFKSKKISLLHFSQSTLVIPTKVSRDIARGKRHFGEFDLKRPRPRGMAAILRVWITFLHFSPIYFRYSIRT